jgi:hypothetical protein
MTTFMRTPGCPDIDVLRQLGHNVVVVPDNSELVKAMASLQKAAKEATEDFGEFVKAMSEGKYFVGDPEQEPPHKPLSVSDPGHTHSFTHGRTLGDGDTLKFTYTVTTE